MSFGIDLGIDTYTQTQRKRKRVAHTRSSHACACAQQKYRPSIGPLLFTFLGSVFIFSIELYLHLSQSGKQWGTLEPHWPKTGKRTPKSQECNLKWSAPQVQSVCTSPPILKSSRSHAHAPAHEYGKSGIQCDPVRLRPWACISPINNC